MTLKPLANAFILRSSDPTIVDRVEAKLRAHPAITRVGRTGSWLWSIADLPGPAASTIAVVDHDSVGLFMESGSLDMSGPRGVVDQALAASPEELLRLRELPGDVGFAVINATADRAVVSRSCGGLVPWLVLHRDDLTVVSTRVAWFARFVPEFVKRDEMALVASVDGISLPDRRTPWVGVRSVPSGTAAVLERGRPAREVEYWDPVELTPERSVGPRGVRDAAVALREIVVKDLDSEIVDDGSNLFALSGGVDSSVVASVAAGILGRSLMSFTLASPEGSAVAETNQQFLDSIHAKVRPTRSWTFPLADDDWIPLAQRAPRVGMCVPHPALALLPSIASEVPVSVYCGGELADDLFAGPFLMWMDWFEALGPVGLVRSLARPGAWVSRKQLARRRAGVVRRRLRGAPSKRMFLDPLPSHFRADIRDEHQDWIDRCTDRFRSDRRPYAHLSMMRELDGWLLQNWEVCSSLRIRRSVPFATRGVIELACSLHPSDHALPPKRLIREAFKRDVPTTNLLRVDKGAEGGSGPMVRTSVSVCPEICALLEPWVEGVEPGAFKREKTTARSNVMLPAGDALGVAVLDRAFTDPGGSV